MESRKKYQELFDSQLWTSFVGGVAQGLHLNLTVVYSKECLVLLGTPEECKACKRAYSPLARGWTFPDVWDFAPRRQSYSTSINGSEAIVVSIADQAFIIARECSCLKDPTPPLEERTKVAGQLISCFWTVLNEGLGAGHQSLLLSTLRHMNHIGLMLMQDKEMVSLEYAINLILSALIILLESPGSWCRYRDRDGEHLLVRGSEDLVSSAISADTADNYLTISVEAGSVTGEIGVLKPCDLTQSETLLPLMAQECSIVLRIHTLLKAVQRQIKNVFDSIQTGLLLVDANGHISYANKASSLALGLQVTDLLGSPLSDIPGPWNERPMNGEHGEGGRMVPITSNGKALWVDWSYQPLRDDGVTVGFVIIIEDRSTDYYLKEATRQAERHATTAALVGALAHEIRNPLTGAKGMLQLICKDPYSQKTPEYARICTQELDRVVQLLNEFLRLGKPARIQTEPVNLKTMVEQVLEMAHAETTGTQITVLSHLEDVPCVEVDPTQVRQVFYNLLRNAIEAVGNEGRIEVVLRAYGSEVEVAISDSGPGLPHVLETLCQPFFTTKEEGTGLGLSVSEEIIRSHKGRVVAHNLPEGGAVFSVYLPLFKQGERPIDVLIIMGEEYDGYSAELLLRFCDYRVVSFASLQEALEHVKEDPLIILSDMPTSNYPRISKVWPLSHVILLGERTTLFQASNLEFLPYPMDCAQLATRIHSIMSRLKGIAI